MSEPRRRKIQELIGLMEKNLECSICLDMMKYPVSTTCGHQFCRFCLMEFLERKKQVPCPLCKKPITKRSLMNRTELGQMVDNVRTLISAFQSDTGTLFSPPRGPHSIDLDLLQCTPDPIVAKKATESRGKTIQSKDKVTNEKGTKGRNVRIARRRTVDNSELDLLCGTEQSVNFKKPDRKERVTKAKDQTKTKEPVNKDDHSETPRPNNTADAKLLQYIENGEHSYKSSDTPNENEKDKTVLDMNEPSCCVTDKIDLNLPPENNADDILSKTADFETKSVEGSALNDFKDKETSEINDLENEPCIVKHNDDSCPLFKTPITVTTMSKLCSQGKKESKECKGRALRSRNKKAVPVNVEISNDTDCIEQLTPDSVSGTVSFEDDKSKPIIKTYGKRSSYPQDKEANKKVSEWLKSVQLNINDDNNATKSDKLNGSRLQNSKRGLKLKMDEEKMGQKLKHLAQNLHTDTHGNEQCFGFFDDEINSNVLDTKHTDAMEHKNDVGKDEELEANNEVNNLESTLNSQALINNTLQNQTYIAEKTEETPENRTLLLEETCQDVETETLSSSKTKDDNSRQNCPVPVYTDKIDFGENNILLNKKPIFKSRTSNWKHISGVENKLVLGNDNASSDPYEFRSSPNTPKKDKRKKGKVSKLAKSKNNKQVLNIDILEKRHGMRKTTGLKSGTRGATLQKKSEMPAEKTSLDNNLSCTQEELKKLSSKIDQAEDHDLLTCTQEAVDSIEEHASDLMIDKEDKDGVLGNSVPQASCLARTETNESKAKSSQQKRVRFQDPIISDFIHSGKIDILGYRKAKEAVKNTKENTVTDEAKVQDIEEMVPANDELMLATNDNTVVMVPDDMVDESENVLDQQRGKQSEQGTVTGTATKQKSPTSPYQLMNSNLQLEGNVHFPTDLAMKITSVAFRNPMMTPTMLKSSPNKGSSDVSERQTSEHEDDDAESSGTDDLNINPEEDQFEEPDIDIQPEDIKDKLSSQDLFVQKVLSTPEESANKGASPQVIMETPAVFAVPKLSSFKKPADMKKAKEQEILSIAETPLIMPENSPKEDFLSVSSMNSFDNGAETEEVRDKDSESIVRVESEETISPSQAVSSVSGNVESVKVEHDELPQGNINTTDSLYASSQEDSRENSVSLLDPGPNSTLQVAEINGKSTILCNGNKSKSSSENTGGSCVSQTSNNISYSLENKQKDKHMRRKKRKSFMLHNDENADIPVVNKSQSFPEQEISEQLPKRMRLSDVQSSISDIHGTGLIENNKRAENNNANMILESEVISQGDRMQTSPPRKVCTPDSLENSMLDGIRISSEIKDGKTKELSSNSNVVLESFDIKKANPNLNKISENDIVNDSNLSKPVAETSLVAIAESVQPESVQSDISTMDPDSIDIVNKPLSQKLYVPETEVVDCSSSSQMTLKPCISDEVELESKQSQNECVSQEENIENQREDVKGKKRPDEFDPKHRHLSGMLVSPEDLEMTKNSKGSLEDIFTIDSEMPIVDCSPMEQTIEQTYGSEDEKDVLNMPKVCDIKQSPSHCKEWSRKSPDNSQLQKGSADGEEMKKDQLKNKKVTCSTNRNEHGHGKNPSGNKVVEGMDDSSESDLSQQEKRKRRSGIKTARGFASKKKQNHDSNSDTSSSLRTKSKSASSSVEVENSALTNCSSDNKVQSSFNLDIAAKRSPAGKRGDYDSGSFQTNVNDITLHSRTLAKDIPENGITQKGKVGSSSSDSEEDLPELSQKHSRNSSRLQNGMNNFKMTEKDFTYSKAEKDADTVTNGNDAIKSSADMQLSAIKETPNAIANDENESTMESDDDNKKSPQDDRNLDNSDTSSSEFQLNSSDEETHKSMVKFQDKEVNKCIKEAKNKILDLEATLSEIKKSESDEEVELSTQGSENSEPQEIESVTADHVKTKKENVDFIGLERKFDTSSPLPERNSPEPMEILESDIDHSDTDSDDGPVMRKKSRKAVIADSSSDDEEDSSRHMNMTSSSAFSSQSENLTTQDKNALEKDLERMAREMEALKAQLRGGRGQATKNRLTIGSQQKNLRNTDKDPSSQELIRLDDDTDLDEHIDMDESVDGRSDNDMFLSPPPLELDPLSQELSIPEHILDRVEQETTEDDNEAVPIKEFKPSSQKSRVVLGDLDVNRPVSPGRKVPKAFVATGLTSLQVQEVKKLASLNDCKFHNKFNDSVTHVIVRPAAESEYLCDRTLKLFQGIANKCWIVNYYWVVDSRHAGHLLPESQYEIQGDTANGEQHQGPEKSRLSQTGLFEDFVFMCVGNSQSLSLDDLVSLIQTCGGVVVPSIELLRQENRTPLIVTCSEVEDDGEDVQLTSQDIATFNKFYKSARVVTVSREWVLDSLTLYELQPLKEYVLTSVKNMVVPKIHL